MFVVRLLKLCNTGILGNDDILELSDGSDELPVLYGLFFVLLQELSDLIRKRSDPRNKSFNEECTGLSPCLFAVLHYSLMARNFFLL